MRDYQEVILKFVNIIEKYPELYNPNHDSYRTRRAELAWDRIAETVTAELNEQCTVEELKTKWKGIRSSYIRYRNKISKLPEATPYKKYYLYDSLKFLEPFSKSKSHPKDDGYFRGRTFEESGNSDDEDSTRDFAPDGMDNWEVTVKPEIEEDNENILNAKDVLDVAYENIQDPEVIYDKAKKRKYDDASDATINEDLHFFKSILPDIKDFSVKEKRRFKMGILKLIDDIEESREQMNPLHEVSSSKVKRQE